MTRWWHGFSCILDCGQKTESIDDRAFRLKDEPCLANPYGMVLVERADEGSDSIGWAPASKARVHPKGIAVHTARAAHATDWPSELPAFSEEEIRSFRAMLGSHDIKTDAWGTADGSKSVERLYWEAHRQRGCVLTPRVAGARAGGIRRIARLVKIRLSAEIFGVEHILLSRMQFMHDGRTIERKQVPLRKLAWHESIDGSAVPWGEAALCAESCPYTEAWREGCRKALVERLGLSEEWQRKHLEEDVHSHSYRVEADTDSAGFPGLPTTYCIHEVTLRVADSSSPGVACIGLPHGQEFATAEGAFDATAYDEHRRLPIGTQLNIWTWDREQTCDATKSMAPAQSKVMMKRMSTRSALVTKGVSLPALSSQVYASMKMRLDQAELAPQAPNATLAAIMAGQKTDWSAVKRMAKHIADPKYSLRQFHKDVSSFPELSLYLLERDELSGAVTIFSSNTTLESASLSSGRSLGDEFQRTVGAFFAVYWLMRIPLDGKDGFAYGVDEDWSPIRDGTVDESRLYPADKRIKFHAEAQWDFFERLLCDAGLITMDKKGKWKIQEGRVLSLLALTAVHDIMKMEALLPRVQRKHAPYHAYQEGDVIADHDAALSYLMDHYPHMLPSFRDLSAEERKSVQFTQCNISFNHGWFVQAEAPPGAVFTKFRETLVREKGSKVSRRDIALYFVHWLTDLAGAEPTPLGGCEKFVVKFPLPVLNSFLRSFEFVERIAEQTETQVMEEYIKVRWKEHTPSLGPFPIGDSAIAKMRMVCMAQMNADRIVQGWGDLSPEDRKVLSVEMARTGCTGQSYSANLAPHEVVSRCEGPAFLVYYGPAFFQNLGNDKASMKLAVLAELYRCARTIWPENKAQAAKIVIVRIDTIKALSIAQMVQASQAGDMWVLMKHNDSEAFIERCSRRKFNKFVSAGQSAQILDLDCLMEGQ